MIAPLRLEPCDPRRLLASGSRLALPPRTVHLWAFESARADTGAAALRDRCHALLDAAERARAARFLFAEHRHDYVVFHAVLRSVLARYVGLPATDLAFRASEGGKPSLSGVEFSLSHSADRALLAVSAREPVGADLEHERADIDVLGIAGHYFHGAEHVAVCAAASQGAVAARAAFFRHWVAKEAVLKGAGHGLGFPLDRFGVHFSPGGGVATISSLDAGRVAPDWQLRLLDVGAACPGAVAVRGADWQFEVPALAD